MGAVTKLLARIGTTGREIKVSGRNAWMLNELVKAGPAGVSPLDASPAMRVAHYVFRLRREGVAIETVDEKHGGTFSGVHARYRLLVPVEILAKEEAA